MLQQETELLKEGNILVVDNLISNDYLLKNIRLYQMHVDNTEDVVENVTRKIVNFIKQRK